MTATQPVRNSEKHILSQVGNVNNLPDSSTTISASTVLRKIEEFRQQVLKDRTRMGYHDSESDSWRREKWEISSAKVFALGLVEDAVIDLATAENAVSFPLPVNLTGEKSILTELEFLRESIFLIRGGILGRDHLNPLLNGADLALESVEWIQSKLSGSAGTQPLTSEETPEPEPCCCKVPASNLPQWLDSLSVADLHTVSELALEAMERKPGAEYEWNVADKFAEALGRR